MSTISDGSDADSFDERSQEGSSIANDFALPAFNVRDFASEAAEVQSFLSMAQEAAVQRDSERIRQWSSSVV